MRLLQRGFCDIIRVIMEGDTILKATNLSKTYGKKTTAFRALKDIDLEIKKGESVAIIGKSGSGKSTLMHILALLDTPTTGTLRVNGQNARKFNKRQLAKLRNETFGFVFQQFFMNNDDTVLDNVILPLSIAKVPRRQRKRRALSALKVVGLADKAKNKARDLSGGQKQRVCIARAIVNNPKVIFADEPTGNLDSATGEKVEQILFRFHERLGATLVIVTHDEALAAKCQRQIRISDGLVVEETNSASAKSAAASESGSAGARSVAAKSGTASVSASASAARRMSESLGATTQVRKTAGVRRIK